MKEYFEAKTAQRWYNKKENYKNPVMYTFLDQDLSLTKTLFKS